MPYLIRGIESRFSSRGVEERGKERCWPARKGAVPETVRSPKVPKGGTLLRMAEGKSLEGGTKSQSSLWVMQLF